MIKVCDWCNKEFETKSSRARYCSDTHYKSCENPECSNTFPIREMKRPAKTCSKKCADVLTMAGSRVEKECELCGDLFISSVSHQKVCNKTHYAECAVCGNEFELVATGKRAAKTCSKKCASSLIDYDDRNQKIVDSTRKKFGVDNVSQSSEIKAKKRETTLKNYGVENPSQSDEVKKRREETMIEKYGVSNAMYSDEIKEKLIDSVNEKYGVDNVFMNEDVKAKASETMIKNYGVDNIFKLPSVQLKAAQNNGKRISQLNKHWQDNIYTSTGVKLSNEVVFGGSNYADLGNDSLLIDINPTITHNSTASYIHTSGKCMEKDCQNERHQARDTDYHYNRFIQSEKNNKEFIQFFDWYNNNAFLSIVNEKLNKNFTIIPNDNISIKELSEAETLKFLRDNYIKRVMEIDDFSSIGLVSEDGKLLHVIVYSNDNRNIEIIHYCNALKKRVENVDSIVKNYFIDNFSPERITRTIDLSLGEKINDDDWTIMSESKPSATWINLLPLTGLKKVKFGERIAISEKDLTYNNIVSLIGADKISSSPSLSASEILLKEGFVRVFDAGTRAYTWQS